MTVHEIILNITLGVAASLIGGYFILLIDKSQREEVKKFDDLNTCPKECECVCPTKDKSSNQKSPNSSIELNSVNKTIINKMGIMLIITGVISLLLFLIFIIIFKQNELA